MFVISGECLRGYVMDHNELYLHLATINDMFDTVTTDYIYSVQNVIQNLILI